ncbi:MAG: alpha/beta hydrolase [Calothrix sp. C42_A2020_038]|nr:alpha/beta hydrolase [Calothrix sp. C42_A2020_038]
MSSKRILALIIALLLIALSWWNVLAAEASLVIRHIQRAGVPLLYMAPQLQNDQKVPGVLIAHGYAGSKQLMLGYAYTFAHAGYAVMLWDFNSHAANTQPLQPDSLSSNLNVAYTALIEQPEVDTLRLATLGHSMGSGAVMSAAIDNGSNYAATIAVSPTGARPTPNAPRNLQLQAGSWEGRFIENAQRLLRAAGGENRNFADGRARELVIIPNAEHITILFRTGSHEAARNWLDTTFGVQRQSNYVDHRIIWYFIQLLAWLVALGAITPIFNVNLSQKSPKIVNWAGLLAAPFFASGALMLFNNFGNVESLGGILVGGAVSIWFGVAGITWLTIMSRLPRLRIQAFFAGLGLFVLLWIGFGAMAQIVWLQWLLVPVRFKLFPILAITCFPWFLASGVTQQNLTFKKRVLWWLGQSIVLVCGFILVLYLLPQLGFIGLLLPIFPVLAAIFSFTASVLNEPWSYAICNALFFAWALAATFPLAS